MRGIAPGTVALAGRRIEYDEIVAIVDSWAGWRSRRIKSSEPLAGWAALGHGSGRGSRFDLDRFAVPFDTDRRIV
jgi:hypothetical protein